MRRWLQKDEASTKLRIRAEHLVLSIVSMLVWMAMLLGAAQAQPKGPRLALVVGNSNYEAVYSLKNAATDARTVADSLTGLGFDVTFVEDGTLAEMNAAIESLVKRANQGAEATLFYFSGHGFQLRGANYIVPTDAVLDNRDAIEARTLRLDDIIGRLSSESRQTLILLDACRDNPLPESVRDKDAANGLAQIETGVNTYIAFATAPGAVSTDGGGKGGPFAKALVSNMSVPEISITEMMRNVRNAVYEETGGVQMPWASDSLLADFSFNRGVNVASLEPGIILGPKPDKKPTVTVVLDPEPKPEPKPDPGSIVATEVPIDEPVVSDPLPDKDQVASVDPKLVLPPVDAPVVSGTDVDLGDTPAIDEPAPEEDPLKVAMAVQTELKRLGCYTGTIDGDFGNGSKRALQRYFDNKKVPSAGSEPSQQIHALLTVEKDVVCQPEVVVQTTKKPAATGGGQTATVKKEPTVKKETAPVTTTTKKPLTLGGGSGVFR